ncbi:MAG: ribulose-phosphate 3-epimerase [Candidatus Sumerlaeia bacterium]
MGAGAGADPKPEPFMTPPPTAQPRDSKPVWPPRLPLIAPSILSADFTDLKRALRQVERARCPWIHLDVMDGHFVPNMTFGFAPVRWMRRAAPRLFFDTHIMVEAPERFVDGFADAGADLITFHEEAARGRAHAVIRRIRARGLRAGLSIKPRTALRHALPFVEKLDLVLIMTVEPGFGGQALIPNTLNKIRELDLFRKNEGLSFLIEVDGGINPDTISLAAAAGADVFVAGHAVFGSGDVRANVRALMAGLQK